ncbi:MAG: metal-sensitive transcriptional regulator [Firmicutes bacterium]|jgi:DNA-binding FrmR family transcriptional regulator|nr:metal-sensitive transcriptional regulator [Bacillota bacterium]
MRQAGKPRQVFWDTEDIIRRLKRIEGQVRGVQAMVEREATCHDVLTQVAAIEGAIKQVYRIVSACSVAEYLAEMVSADVSANEVKDALKELIRNG